MGQKVNPNGFRLGVNRTWSSRWFSKSNYAKFLHQDLEIKSYVEKKLKNASIAKINIERAAKKIRISIYSSRPGIIIGKKGADIEDLKNKLTKLSNLEVFLDIKEIRKPEVEAKLVAENIATQLEKRVSFRRAMKKSVQSSMRLGAKGVKVLCSGRLGGAEIATREAKYEANVLANEVAEANKDIRDELILEYESRVGNKSISTEVNGHLQIDINKANSRDLF